MDKVASPRRLTLSSPWSHRTVWLVFLLGCLLAEPSAAAKPVRVKIKGVTGKLQDNARAFLSITKLDTASAAMIRRQHRQAPEEIRQALRPFGYYDPQIETKLTETDAEWIARYRIDPGPAVRIRTLDLRVVGPGKGDPVFQGGLTSPRLAPGKRLQHAAYSQTKQSLLEAAYDGGFLDASFTRSEIRVYPKAQSADIHLVLDTGPRYHFGKLQIEQKILDPDFVRRYSPFEPGDPFDPQQLLELQNLLTNSPYFDRVEIETKREQAKTILSSPDGSEPLRQKQIPVALNLKPRPPRQYRVGVGFGTNTGPRLRGGLFIRRLNRQGHRLRLDFGVSTIGQNTSVSYEIPLANVATDHLAFLGGVQRQEFGDDRSRKFTARTSYDKQWFGWQRSLYTSFAREISDSSGQTDFLTPGIRLTRSQADDPLLPSRGWSITFDTHGAADALLSETNFVQARLDLRTVSSPIDRLRLLLRGTVGATSFGDFNKFPLSERFFAGGNQSVRGYSFRSLGTRDAKGNVVGGRHLLVGSTELEYRIWGDWGLAAFYDAGNAANEFPPDLLSGTGLGLRWASPVGMVRLDFAWPVSRPAKGLRLHFSIGPSL